MPCDFPVLLSFREGTGAVVPFMPVFARQLGVSTVVVGIIYSILPILGLIAKPLFGAVADRYVNYTYLMFQAQPDFVCLRFYIFLAQNLFISDIIDTRHYS